jgi:hypothetical protein
VTFGEKAATMRELFATIRKLVAEDKYIVGNMRPSGSKNGGLWNGRWLLVWRREN